MKDNPCKEILIPKNTSITKVLNDRITRLEKAMEIANMHDFCYDSDGSLWRDEFLAAMRNEHK